MYYLNLIIFLFVKHYIDLCLFIKLICYKLLLFTHQIRNLQYKVFRKKPKNIIVYNIILYNQK